MLETLNVAAITAFVLVYLPIIQFILRING
nr:MAG TPA: hypothetical protein [Caudoviricetes sp.]